MAKFDTLAGVWRNWNEVGDKLHGHNQHYPPGALFLLKTEQMWGLQGGLLRSITIIATLACGPIMFLFARLIGADSTTALISVFIFVVSTGPVVFPAISITPLTMFLHLSVHALFLHALIRGRVMSAFISGGLLALYFLLSFNVFITGLMLGILCMVGVIFKFSTWRRVMTMSVVCLLTIIVLLFLFGLATGYDVVENLQIAITNNSAAMTRDPFHTLQRYLLRSSGNLLAYLVQSGVILSVLAMLGLAKLSKAPLGMKVYGFAWLATLIFSSLSGLFFLETARIWIFFTPTLALVAAWGITSRRHPESMQVIAAIILLSVSINTGVHQLSFRDHWAKPIVPNTVRMLDGRPPG